ncbi:hypothetical protein [Sinorhizobium fredii]|uniref:hypothetical protein n=1 Tax=Rhizobium fredii TaxID=380 RepID=UPI0012FE1FD3|nr:hypothetical protein [Sinorhizobium fredii]
MNNDETISQLVDAVNSLSERLLKAEGRLLGTGIVLKQLRILPLVDSPIFQEAWEAGLAATRKEWETALETADEPTAVLIESAIDVLSNYGITGMFDGPDRRLFEVIRGGKDDA